MLKSTFLLALLPAVLFGNDPSGDVRDRKEGKVVLLENEKVRARFEKTADIVKQEFFAKRKGEWILVAESFRPPSSYPKEANQLLNVSVSPYRYLTASSGNSISAVKSDDAGSTVTISGKVRGVDVVQEITLPRNSNRFYVKVHAILPPGQDKLEYLLSSYRFVHEGTPEFVHTPTLKYNEERWETPAEQQILGDRSFHSPAIVLQQKDLFMAMVPD